MPAGELFLKHRCLKSCATNDQSLPVCYAQAHDQAQLLVRQSGPIKPTTLHAGAENLFCGVNSKLCQYNFAESFFGGVAPLVRHLLSDTKEVFGLAPRALPLQDM